MTRAQTQNNQRDTRGNVAEQKALSGNMQNKHEKKCYLCHRFGHFMNNCPLRRTTDRETTSGKPWDGKPKSGQYQAEGKDKVGLIHSPTMTRKSLALEVPVTVESKDVVEDTKRIGLKIENGKVNSKEASVLRDTGCTSILVAEKLINKEDLTGGRSGSYTCEWVCNGMSGGVD